jgi:hypothetical protein
LNIKILIRAAINSIARHTSRVEGKYKYNKVKEAILLIVIRRSDICNDICDNICNNCSEVCNKVCNKVYNEVCGEVCNKVYSEV